MQFSFLAKLAGLHYLKSNLDAVCVEVHDYTQIPDDKEEDSMASLANMNSIVDTQLLENLITCDKKVGEVPAPNEFEELDQIVGST